MRTLMRWLWVFLAMIFGLGVGLLIGWVLWPIEWINAAPEQLRMEFQTDWMNMAIDSYSVNSNAQLATQRFDQLGPNGPEILTEIVKNPVWVTEADAQAYAGAVGQSIAAASLQNAAKTVSAFLTELFKPTLAPYTALLLFLALVAIILLVVLVIRLASKKPKKEEDAAVAEVAEEGQPAEVVTEEPAVEEVSQDTEVTVAEGEEGISAGELAAAAVATKGVEWALETEPEAAVVPVEEPLPVVEAAASEEAVSDQEGDRGIGIGELAAAGLVAAAVAGDHQEEAVVEEAVVEEEAAPVVETVEGSDSVEEGAESAPESEWVAVAAATAMVAEAESKTEETSELPSQVEAPEVVEEAIDEQPADDLPKFLYGRYNRKIIEIEGVGPAYAEKLTAAGIPTTQALLQECATEKGREDLASRTGISGKLILEWSNHADMMRIQGIGPEWSDLLEMAGVNTVRELAVRNPNNLYDKLIDINNEKKLVRKLPTQAQVEDWVEQAKELPRILTY